MLLQPEKLSVFLKKLFTLPCAFPHSLISQICRTDVFTADKQRQREIFKLTRFSGADGTNALIAAPVSEKGVLTNS